MLWQRLPWERTRALRLLNLQTRLDLRIGTERAASMDQATFFLIRNTEADLAAQRNSELLNALRSLIGGVDLSRQREKDDHGIARYAVGKQSGHRDGPSRRAVSFWPSKRGS